MLRSRAQRGVSKDGWPGAQLLQREWQSKALGTR
jgi:hypothetical protein